MITTTKFRKARSRSPRIAVPNQDFSQDTFRQIYASLELPSDRFPVIGIISAIAGEGRTTVATRLAETLSEDLASPVVLVDADVNNPSLAARFNLAPSPGLAEVIRGKILLEDALHAVRDNLFVLTAGATSLDGPRLLRQLLTEGNFHPAQLLPWTVVVDFPPILVESYAAVAAGIADALLLVVRAGVTPSDITREAVSRLNDQPIQGVVLNGFRSALPSWWPGPTI